MAALHLFFTWNDFLSSSPFLRSSINWLLYTYYTFQISYGGASPVLSDRKRFPKLFRLHAQASRFNLARIALARYYNWKKVATLNVAQDYFSGVSWFPGLIITICLITIARCLYPSGRSTCELTGPTGSSPQHTFWVRNNFQICTIHYV